MITATTYPDGVTYYETKARGVTYLAHLSPISGKWQTAAYRFRSSPGTHHTFATVAALSATVRPFRDLAALVELAPVVVH